MIGGAPLAIDLGTSGYSTPQLALAVLLFVVFFAALTVLTWRLQYLGLEGDQPQHKRALRESKTRRDPEVSRFSREALEESPARVRRELRELFESASGEDVELRERPTVRGALLEVRSTVRETWRETTSDVPGAALKLLERGLLVAIMGAVAVSTSTVVTYLTKDPDYPTAADVVAETQEYAGKGSSTLLEVLGLFPFSDLVWALLFTAAFRIGGWLYANWYVVAGALVATGVGVWLLEREVLEEPRRELLWSRRRTGYRLVWILLPTFLAGAVPVAVGELVGYPGVAEMVGLAIAVVTFGLGAALALRRASTEALWSTVHRDEPVGALLLHMSLRHVGAILGALSLPLVALYVVVGLADGSVAAVVAAYLEASRGVQALVALVGVANVALVVYMARGAAPAVREALVETLSRATVRTVLLVRGVPYLAVILTYLLAFGFNLPFAAAVVAAIVAGVLGRLAVVAALRMRATASLFGEWLQPDESALFLVVRAYELRDADGEPRYYADLNSRAVAHDSIEDVVDAVLELADELVDETVSDPTVPQEYADDLLERGLVGIESTRKKLEQRIREETEGRLEREGMVAESALESDLADKYPEELYREKLREWRLRGVLRRRDGYLYLAR